MVLPYFVNEGNKSENVGDFHKYPAWAMTEQKHVCGSFDLNLVFILVSQGCYSILSQTLLFLLVWEVFWCCSIENRDSHPIPKVGLLPWFLHPQPSFLILYGHSYWLTSQTVPNHFLWSGLLQYIARFMSFQRWGSMSGLPTQQCWAQQPFVSIETKRIFGGLIYYHRIYFLEARNTKIDSLLITFWTCK